MSKNTIWMQPPDGGPPEEIKMDDNGLKYSQKVVLHWTVCDAPTTPKATSAAKGKGVTDAS